MNECGDGVALQYKAAFWPSAKDLDNWKKSLTTGHTILKVWFISFVMQVATNISVLLSKSIQALAALCYYTNQTEFIAYGSLFHHNGTGSPLNLSLQNASQNLLSLCCIGIYG